MAKFIEVHTKNYNVRLLINFDYIDIVDETNRHAVISVRRLNGSHIEELSETYDEIKDKLCGCRTDYDTGYKAGCQDQRYVDIALIQEYLEHTLEDNFTKRDIIDGVMDLINSQRHENKVQETE